VSYAPRLLSALIALDGEALVLHPGDVPYIAAPGGPVDVASRPLTAAALDALVRELLPEESREELRRQRFSEWRAPRSARYPAERISVVAAFVGDELWVEVRRQRRAAAPPHADSGHDELKLPSAEELWPGDDSL
jgi:hypothetical protein